MADPSYDDARDLRAALGGLLVDEPPGRTPLADDVARGRALRRRRRVRAGTGAALVAVLALVVGTGGVLRHGAAPAGPSTPSPAPTDPGPRVSALLTELGWVVDGMVLQKVPSGSPSVTTWTVHDRASAGPLSAQLTVRVWSESSWGPGTTMPPGSVLSRCSVSGLCGVVSSAVTDCVSGTAPCWSTSWTTIVRASAGLPRGTAVLLAYDGRAQRAVEAVATPADCLTCASPQAAAFLDRQQLSRVIALVEPAPVEPSPSSTDVPASLAACRPQELKIIPGEGSPTETVGSSGLWVEIHARNPEVDCVLRGRPTVQLLDSGGHPLAVSYVDGIYQAADFPDAPVEVSQALGPARFALSTARCDGATTGPADRAVVGVGATGAAVSVELVAVSGQLTTCPSAVTGASGEVVHVSRFTR